MVETGHWGPWDSNKINYEDTRICKHLDEPEKLVKEKRLSSSEMKKVKDKDLKLIMKF